MLDSSVTYPLSRFQRGRVRVGAKTADKKRILNLVRLALSPTLSHGRGGKLLKCPIMTRSAYLDPP